MVAPSAIIPMCKKAQFPVHLVCLQNRDTAPLTMKTDYFPTIRNIRSMKHFYDRYGRKNKYINTLLKNLFPRHLSSFDHKCLMAHSHCQYLLVDLMLCQLKLRRFKMIPMDEQGGYLKIFRDMQLHLFTNLQP